MMNTPHDLNGKTALITGASSAGLGRYFATALAEAGAHVVLSARRIEPLQQLADEITARGGHAAVAQMDVTDKAQVKTVMATYPFDIVVNNAGISIAKPLLEQTEEDYDRVMDINLKGVWTVGTEAARSMREAGRTGSIINIASITGLRQVSHITPYAVSKAAVIHLTKQMALELARYDIRVNAIAPGYFESDMTRDFFASDAGQALIRRIPMRRTGDLESLGAALMMLSSDASRYITGSVITVDGGHATSSL